MVPKVSRPWVGTEAREARDNVAATTCDRTDFAVDPVRSNVTRTFLIPDARLPATFGVTETAGSLPSDARPARSSRPSGARWTPAPTATSVPT